MSSEIIVNITDARPEIVANITASGPRGEKGEKGLMGLQGLQGVPGLDGLTTSVNGVSHVNGEIALTQDNVPDGTTNKAYTATEKTKLSGIATNANNYSHPTTHPPSIIEQDASNRFVTDAEKSTWNGKQNALGYTPLNSTLKGAVNGIAELDANGRVPSSQLPSYVDDVLEYANISLFPVTGESGKIYIASDINLTYRWSGTGYVEISPSIALGETSATAYRGDRGKTAYEHSQTAHAPSNATANDTDANLRDRSTHTGTQSADTITDGTTNKAYTATEKTKLSGIATNANNYSHPTTAGNKHIPSDGASGQILRYSASGTAVWGADNDTVTTINGKTGAIVKADIVALGIPAQDTIVDISGKVDKVDGKGLSTEDYTTAEKTKLAGIAAGAEANVQSDWNASSGDAQILNKPTSMTPTAHNQAATTITVTDSGGYFTGTNAETVLQEIGSTLNGLEAAITAITG